MEEALALYRKEDLLSSPPDDRDAPQARPRPKSVWLRSFGYAVMRALAPGFAVPQICPACWSKMEVLDDRLVENEEDQLLLRGLRRRRFERYAYPHRFMIWEE